MSLNLGRSSNVQWSLPEAAWSPRNRTGSLTRKRCNYKIFAAFSAMTKPTALVLGPRGSCCYFCRVKNADGIQENNVLRRCLSSNSVTPPQRPDPLARRPNKVCDPYGQEGKPMSHEEAHELLVTTLDKEWSFEMPLTTEQQPPPPPLCLIRQFHHDDYWQGSQFVSKMAAVAHNHNHYPTITLERKLLAKSWQVVTKVKCQTVTLGGLSRHDFYVALMMDVEVERPQVQSLISSPPKGN